MTTDVTADVSTSDGAATGRTAREDWDERFGRPSGDATRHGARERIAAPTGLRALPGVGTVTLHWEPVDGAVGYQVLRAREATTGDVLSPLDYGGGDVLAIPHGPWTDTTGEPGVHYRYAVVALSDVVVRGGVSDEVRAASLEPRPGERPRIEVGVDARGVLRDLPRPWRPMIGSEHLSLLLSGDEVGGHRIADDLAGALRAAHDELGVQTVRAHAILGDDLGVYREVDGRPVHDFTKVDQVLDAIRGLGLYPVVELSFMPRDLAADPTRTVFEYGAIVSPPKDWDRWAALITDLARHLAARYGLEELREEWAFEVWNEPNLEVFWAGTPEAYWRLYDVTAAALRSVDSGLRVGGPATAADGWVGEFLEHTAADGTAVDFVSTHTYGQVPLDLRPVLARHGHAGTPLWWTEWGATRSWHGPVNDGVPSAVLIARGMKSAAGRIDAVSYWVASDVFEELGRPERLLHEGFGLRTIGGLRKPRWWALHLLERLGTAELACRVTGDGAGGMVECWASRDEEPDGDPGEVTVALWNGTLDQTKVNGATHLDRDVVVHVDRLPDGAYEVFERRIDAAHSNVCALWGSIADGADWPDEDQWHTLRQADRLDDGALPRHLVAEHGRITVELTLPSPSMVLLEIVPLPRG